MPEKNDEQIDIRQMEAFSAVMSAGSITGAARLLGRSQPALSRLIQDLESRLGFQLLHRNGPRVSPTERGILFHEDVERLLSSVQLIQERAAAIGRDETRAFEIDAIPALASGLLPAVIARMAQTDVPRQLHLRSSAAEKVVQSVLASTADVGVTSLPVDHAGLDLHWIGDSDCVAVVAANDPLANCDVFPIATLRERRLITVGNPYRLRGRIDRALRQADVKPNEVFVTNASINAIMAAHAGLGIALVEPATAYAVPVSGVRVLPIDVRIPYYWGVFTVSGRPIAPPISAFISTLSLVAKETLPNFTIHSAAEMDTLRDAIFGPYDGADQ
jgi:DNA-binding transcriptional LysR family regulator